MFHLPVMQKEVIELLDPRPDGIYVDATVGPGGHAERILQMIGPGGKLFGIDRDEDALKRAHKRLSNERVFLRKGNYSDMEAILHEEGFAEVDGILLDLGVSTLQLKEAERGFSFTSKAPLNMRMDRSQSLSAWDVVNKYPERAIERILREYGEERFSRKIANAIMRYRKRKTIDTCEELSKIIESVYGRRGKIHPATRTFQALRIEVNRELDYLTVALNSSLRMLKKGGRLCVISYHSLEDRIVKNFMKESSRSHLLRIITKKPLTPGIDEVASNPSARSAKLRVAEMI
ncbi:MAG: 16S rRNA (cytosine(1402)-N(4))-methyltransferase RsmH [Nitrospirota bacterium]